MSDPFLPFEEEEEKASVYYAWSPWSAHWLEAPSSLYEVHLPKHSWGQTRVWGQTRASSPTMHYLGSAPKPPLLESREATQESVSDYERLSARHKMLLALVGSEELSSRLEHLFPYKLEKGRIFLVIEQRDDASLTDYVRFLGSVDRLYRLLLTLVHQGYFYDRWLRGVLPTIASADLLKVEKLVKQSPAEVQVSAIAEAARALGDVLSIGKQVTDFRTAGVKVEEAKIELEKKKRELEDDDRKRQQQTVLADLDLELEREKKLLELEQLRTKRDEEQRKRHRLLMEDVEQRLELLSKGIKVLSEVPEEVKAELKAALFTELEIMNTTPLTIKSFEVLPQE